MTTLFCKVPEFLHAAPFASKDSSDGSVASPKHARLRERDQGVERSFTSHESERQRVSNVVSTGSEELVVVTIDILLR
jgi:hypothetical protein